MSKKKLVIHESEGEIVPDICGIAIEIINPETAGSTKISFAKLIIASGQRSRRHHHEKTEEIYYIISGFGRVIVGDQEFDVGPGHTVFIPMRTQHEVVNTATDDLIFVCADAPVFDPDDVFEAQATVI